VHSNVTEQVQGCLVGLAVGDALGAPLEFKPRHEVRSHYPSGLRDMIASKLWDLGEYTDDTEMALLLAESLLECNGLVPREVARRFWNWEKSAKDVGILTQEVLNMRDYLVDPELCAARYYEQHRNASAGNGAVMRCAVVALFYLNDLDALVECSKLSARLTHYDPVAQSSCVILNAWISELIKNDNRSGHLTALEMLADSERAAWQSLGNIESVSESDISSSGYAVHTLEAAAWSFLTTTSFEDAVIRAANLGHDADTVAAVCGAIAGAHYGYSAIPSRWRTVLKDEAKIAQTALALHRRGLAHNPSRPSEAMS
jgi:ADP-ribosyl-[dinitrogen reductase] hydrolase